MDTRIEWAIGALKRHLNGPLRSEELAAMVKLSASRFLHLFRAETGTSPARYLRTCRLERARILLETTSLPVKRIMTIVGINDPSHFARDFRKLHGAPPSKWRKRYPPLGRHHHR